MPERMLTTRELNRALLARQMLLAWEALAVPDAMERLVGLQAQAPNAPYIGLCTRLHGPCRDALTTLPRRRGAVRATLMRATSNVTIGRKPHATASLALIASDGLP